jgi:hypothetical protein
MSKKLYHHKTDGGAEYLCTSPVDGTDEGDLYTAIVRLDGEPELIRPIVSLEVLETIQTQLKAAWGRAHYEEIRVAMQTIRAAIQKARHGG